MEQSILISTKKILGLSDSYTPFDLDVITHINAAFAVLQQLGVGPVGGFSIEDSAPIWEEFLSDTDFSQLNLVKSYVYLYVRMKFDPPSTSFTIEAMNKQIAELEFRINVNRELTIESA